MKVLYKHKIKRNSFCFVNSVMREGYKVSQRFRAASGEYCRKEVSSNCYEGETLQMQIQEIHKSCQS